MIKSLLIPLRLSTLVSILEDLESSLNNALRNFPVGKEGITKDSRTIDELKEQISLVRFQIQTIL